MLFSRQQVLLHTIRCFSRALRLEELHSLLFLIRNKTPIAGMFSFYDFFSNEGYPSSFLVNHDLEYFANKNFVRLSKNIVSICSEYDALLQIKGLPNSIVDIVDKTINSYRTCSDKYRRIRIPFSSISFHKPEDPFDKITKFSRGKKVLMTVGYEGLTIDGFLNNLLRNRVEKIVDVRSHPYSRKYGFSKTELSKFCSHLGIEYLSYPDLGIPSALRRNLDSNTDFQNLWSLYKRNILKEASQKVTQLVDSINATRAALLCFEADPNHCHRSVLAEAIAERISADIKHIQNVY